MQIRLPFKTHKRVSDNRFVEVLTNPQSGMEIGYTLGGAKSGPRFLVVGHAPIIDKIYERLIALPTLPWVCGQIFLVPLDDMDESELSDVLAQLPESSFDEAILLPIMDSQATQIQTVHHGYWKVLRLATQLGMIAGKGVRMQ
jgi:hypothetical protein